MNKEKADKMEKELRSLGFYANMKRSDKYEWVIEVNGKRA